MKKEIDALRVEKNRLNGLNQELQKKNSELNRKLKLKEEDVQTLRVNMNKIKQESQRPGLVMANKGALATIRHNTIPIPPKNRIPNSSSFPSTEPGTSMGERHIQPSPTTTYKKFPVMINSNTIQRGRGVPFLGTKASNLPISRNPHSVKPMNDLETEHLGFVVDSMNSNGMNNSLAKRSSSLPRNSSQPKSEHFQQIKPPSSIPTRHLNPRSLPNPASMGKNTGNITSK